MTDRPKGEGWWLASDGKWYPPHLQPGAPAPITRTPPQDQIPNGLTNALTTLVLSTCGFMLVSAFVSFWFAGVVRDLGIDFNDLTREPTNEELLYFGLIGLVGIAWIASGVVALVWIRRVSKAADARGAAGRRWGGGWFIGAWVVPFANIVLPRLMFAELERVFQVPYRGLPIDGEWRHYDRTVLLDVWWALYLGAAVGRVATFILSGGQAASAAQELAQTARWDAISSLFGAAAGLVFVVVVRRILTSSTRSAQA